jgi:hypothetical protein
MSQNEKQIENKINEKIEFWKSQLMDLSKKNLLINCPIQRKGGRLSRKSIIFEKPTGTELWNELITKKSLRFDIQEDVTGTSIKHSPTHSRDILITTNQSSEEAKKTMQQLLNKYKIFLENKGVNGLHLALGFLNWNEKDLNRDKKKVDENVLF